ncbi:DUF2516 family protein [Corynebacterium striatum]
MNTAYYILANMEHWIFMAVSIFAIVGAVVAATTREDAFRAGDRQGKWTWVGLLVGSAVAMNLHLPFIEWIGAVVSGVYWFDVRPQLKAIINGDYSY